MWSSCTGSLPPTSPLPTGLANSLPAPESLSHSTPAHRSPLLWNWRLRSGCNLSTCANQTRCTSAKSAKKESRLAGLVLKDTGFASSASFHTTRCRKDSEASAWVDMYASHSNAARGEWGWWTGFHILGMERMVEFGGEVWKCLHCGIR